MSNLHDDQINDKGLDEKDERVEILTEFLQRWFTDSLKTDTHPFTYIAERLLETPLEELLETETLEDEAKRLNNE